MVDRSARATLRVSGLKLGKRDALTVFMNLWATPLPDDPSLLRAVVGILKTMPVLDPRNATFAVCDGALSDRVPWHLPIETKGRGKEGEGDSLVITRDCHLASYSKPSSRSDFQPLRNRLVPERPLNQVDHKRLFG